MKASKSLAIKRQAIIIIHGIGEQRPMDTLRGFVSAVAPPIQKSDKPAYYSQPDSASNSYELRRLTANAHKHSHKTDYYELYWANLIQDTRITDVFYWIWYLFARPAGKVPGRIRWVYYTFWISLLVLVSAIVALLPMSSAISEKWHFVQEHNWSKWLVSALSTLVWLTVTGVLVNYLGDAVRYFNPRPHNIAQRQSIRQAGIDLLDRLHNAQENGQNKYDRIIVVGHSLGSVIAYDLVNFFWCARHSKLPVIPVEEIEKAEEAARQFKTDKNIDQYRQSQFDLWHNQYNQPGSWRISDLITLGSPLAFAELLLADNEAAWEDKKKQREYSTCPPTPEIDRHNVERFSYLPVNRNRGPRPGNRLFHHGAAFGMTRWTNIYFTNDFVGGPVNSFGTGVKNIELTSELNHRLPFVAHVYYWRAEEATCIECIRQALELRLFTPSSPTLTDSH